MLNVSAESRITLTLSENTLHDFYWTKVVLSKDLDDSSYCQLYANSRVVNPSDLVGNHYALSDVTSVSKLCEVEHILRQFKVNNSRCFICECYERKFGDKEEVSSQDFLSLTNKSNFCDLSPCSMNGFESWL